MLAALAEAVVDGLQAGRMALGAVVDARVHGLGAMGCCVVGHVVLLRYCDSGRNPARPHHRPHATRSEEHTSELQSLMRISYAVFCLTKKKRQYDEDNYTQLPTRNMNN